MGYRNVCSAGNAIEEDPYNKPCRARDSQPTEERDASHRAKQGHNVHAVASQG